MTESNDPITEEYRGEQITVNDIPHHVCPECGEYMVSAENARALQKALIAQHAESQGLLTPEQIVSIRKSFGLNQEEFQKMLGVTGVTVCRWETGKVQQTKVVDNLLRILGKYPFAAEDLMAWAGMRA